MKKNLSKSKDNKMIFGVCGGIAEYLNINVTLLRLVWALLTTIFFGSGIIIYIICALIFPRYQNYEAKQDLRTEYMKYQKSHTTAFLLCLFFGSVGIHMIYLGKYGLGVFRFVFQSCLIISIFVLSFTRLFLQNSNFNSTVVYQGVLIAFVVFIVWGLIDLFLNKRVVDDCNKAILNELEAKLKNDAIQSINTNWSFKSTSDKQIDVDLTETEKLLNEVAGLNIELKNLEVKELSANICNVTAEIYKQVTNNHDYAVTAREVWKRLLPDTLDCLNKVKQIESITIVSKHIEAEIDERIRNLSILNNKITEILNEIHERRLNDARMDTKISDM